jgi:hypothetical protein
MGERILAVSELAGSAIALFAVAVVVIGLVLSPGRYLSRFRHRTPEENFKRLGPEHSKRSP